MNGKRRIGVFLVLVGFVILLTVPGEPGWSWRVVAANLWGFGAGLLVPDAMPDGET